MWPCMIEHWCGLGVRGLLVALSAAFVACGPHSYELGKDGTGASGEGGEAAGGTSGKGGSAGKGGTGTKGGTGGTATHLGGTGGTGGTANAQGGTKAGGTGGGGTGGGSAAVGGGGTIDLGDSPLMQIGTSPSKLDLLFMIDNSIGMEQKQVELGNAIPALVARLSSCVDADGNRVGNFAPDSCAPGTHAEFGGLNDIHIGIITSSLGDHGSDDVCSDRQNTINTDNGALPSNYNDLALLLPSARPDVEFNDAEQGFLSWDPASANAAHASLDSLARDTAAQINAAKEHGCGYEAQLESWYRFLVDPEPVTTMSNTGDNGALSMRGDTNVVLLAQRQAFLRSDSVLAIVMLTDENDCSVSDENDSQGWLVSYKGGTGANATLWHMPRATSACDTDPSSPCCHPCNNGVVPGCPLDDRDDEACQAGGVTLGLNEDSMNMRCFNQKRRFGVDFLYPVQRYIDALTKTQIRPRGDVNIPNPLFAPGPDGTPGRAGNQIVFAGIVGVPWQDVATPDSLSGSGLTFMSADELAQQGRWDIMLGDPARGVAPTDPLMIESIDERPVGAPHPLVDAAVAGSDETTNVNPINGHEQAVLGIRDNLQFACIYPLASPVTCTDANQDTCDCNADEAPRNSPLCTGTTPTADGTQTYGKAYPAVRELQVLKGAGSNGVVASACPKQPAVAPYDDPNAGYTPALNALADSLLQRFAVPCLARSLPISQCAVIEARPADGGSCESAGRVTPDGYGADVAQRAQSQLAALGYDAQSYAVCQVPELEGDALDACLTSPSERWTEPGFCYLDAEQGLGDPALLASCPASMKHRIRLVGAEVENALTFVACADGR